MINNFKFFSYDDRFSSSERCSFKSFLELERDDLAVDFGRIDRDVFILKERSFLNDRLSSGLTHTK